MPKVLLAVLLAFAPVLFDWVYKEYGQPRPFWIQYYDAETAYFYAGREILAGKLPHTVFRIPGTPVQYLSAALIPLVGDDPDRFEHFRAAGHWTALMLTLAAAVLVGATIFRGLPLSLQVPGFWTFYICSQSLQYNNIWSSNVFYFPIGALALVGIWHAAHRASLSTAFLAGALVGLCCSLKFTFLAWIPALVVSLAMDTRQDGLRRAFASALGVFTGFVGVTLPLARAYPRMLHWLLELVTSQGPYGSGDPEALSVAVLVGNWTSAVLSAKGWFLWLALIAVVIVASTRKTRMPPAVKVVLTFCVVGFLCSYLMVGRQMALRWLLPTGLCAMLLYRIAAGQLLKKPRLMLLPLVIGGLLIGKHVQLDLATHRATLQTGLATHKEVSELIQEASRTEIPVVLYSFRFPQRSLALRLGAYDEAVFQRVSEVYPTEGHYDVWTQKVHLPVGAEEWDFLVIRPKDLVDFGETGPLLGSVDGYVVVAAPSRGPSASQSATTHEPGPPFVGSNDPFF